MALQVDILTPRRQVFSGQANDVRIPGWEGQMGVYPGHDVMLVRTRGGVVTIGSAEGEQRFIVGRGFAEVGPDRVTFLADSCITPADVNAAEAEKDAHAAEQAMAQASAFSPEWDEAERKLEVARAKLRA